MGLFGKSYDYKFNKEAAQQEKMLGLEQAFTENMWNQTNDWNLAQWNRENDYNSPVSQMQRMALAGINPNNAAAAIAGNDSAAGSVQASPVGSPTAPSAPSPVGTDLASSVLGAGSTALDAIMTGVNAYKTIKAEVPNIEANTDNTKKDTQLKDEQVLTTEQQRKNMVEEFKGLQFENMHIKPATYSAITANTQLTVAQKDESIQRLKNLKGEWDLNQQAIEELKEKTRIAHEQVNYWKQQVKVATSEEAKNYAMQQMFKAQGFAASMDAALSKETTRGQRIQNDVNEILAEAGWDPNEHDTETATAKKVVIETQRSKKKSEAEKKKNKATYKKYNPNPFSHGKASSNNHRNMDNWNGVRQSVGDYGVDDY